MRRALTAVALALIVAGPSAARVRKAPAPRARVAPPAAPVAPPVSPELPQHRAIQYLYGSAEAAALTRQTWRILADYVDEQVASGTHKSVILTPDSTLSNPHFVPCDNKPPAIVLDVDETAILNLGAEYDDLMAGRLSFDPAVWDRWEKGGAAYVAPTPGAKEALDRLRDHGVTVIFNSNRKAENANGAAAAINAAGLGPARFGETLFLDDAASKGMKDGRRQQIAARYCVLAMGGDQLIDFSDLFKTEPNGVAARRATVAYSGIADLWGNGWFVMPNPVYGSAIQGDPEDMFPKDKQWRDPGSPTPVAPEAPTETQPKKAK